MLIETVSSTASLGSLALPLALRDLGAGLGHLALTHRLLLLGSVAMVMVSMLGKTMLQVGLGAAGQS